LLFSCESARRLRILSEFRKARETEGCCCAVETKAMPSATNNPNATGTLFFRREKEPFTMFMSKHRRLILPEAALLERINLVRCLRELMTLPGGF
jgi:hypothetical protein